MDSVHRGKYVMGNMIMLPRDLRGMRLQVYPVLMALPCPSNQPGIVTADVLALLPFLRLVL